MASKKEILNLVVGILTDAKVKENVIEAVSEVLRPKTGGNTVDLSEVTRTDEEGNITEIQCSICGVWLPATEEYFYANKTGKGPNGLKRVSKQGESINKAFLKTKRASEKAIMLDFTSGNISPEEAKELFAELEATAPDYSGVGILVDETAEAEVEAE